MKTVIVCIGVALVTLLLALSFKSAKIKAQYSRQALRLTNHELNTAILVLWAETGQKFSFKRSLKLRAFEEEAQRRKIKF